MTRFNIATAGREAPIRNSPGWLERRFYLFEQYCLPSMAAQADRDHHWLIYFDEATPETFRERIESAREQAIFEPIFVDSFSAPDACRDISQRLRMETKRVITTRLDNDDAISKQFLRSVREIAGSLDDGTIINFRDGLALRKGKVFTASDPSNPFTSLVEAADDLRTIWAAPHTDLSKLYRVHQVYNERAWLQVVHGDNVTNRIKGRLIDAEAINNDFLLGSDVIVMPTDALSIFLDRILRYPLRIARELAISLAKIVLMRG